MNIYLLNNATSVDYDNEHIVGAAQDFGVLVECSFEEASKLAREWGAEKPRLAKDGVWISESGDEIFIANGEIVDDIAIVSDVLGYNEKEEESGMAPADYETSHEDFLRNMDRVF